MTVRVASWQALAISVSVALLVGCVPGVFGKWSIELRPTENVLDRVTTVLNQQGFREWKSSVYPAAQNTRFFGHRALPVGVSVLSNERTIDITFEQPGDRISSEAEDILLHIDQALKAEFGGHSVAFVERPRGTVQ